MSTDTTRISWEARAERLLQEALSSIRKEDVLPTISAAETALRIACGELPEDEMDGYPFPGEEEAAGACICPPDLLARGGYRGSCPAHALRCGRGDGS